MVLPTKMQSFGLALCAGILVMQKVITVCSAGSALGGGTQFIVPQEKNKDSRNKLRSDIGGEIRNTLATIGSFQQEVGRLLAHVGDMQQRLLEKGEELLDNKQPFKKASKTDLSSARDLLTQAQRCIDRAAVHLKEAMPTVNRVHQQFDQHVCLKKASSPSA
jgi:hypothetical protein